MKRENIFVRVDGFKDVYLKKMGNIFIFIYIFYMRILDYCWLDSFMVLKIL